jgi:hypothetical protein
LEEILLQVVPASKSLKKLVIMVFINRGARYLEKSVCSFGGFSHLIQKAID